VQTIAFEYFTRDLQPETETEEKVDFEPVKLRIANAAHSGIESIIIVRIIKHLRGDHDTGEEQAMDIEGNDREIRLPVNETVDVDVAYDEAGGATAGVLVNPLQILGYGDGWTADAVEHRDLLSIGGKSALIIPCDQTLEGVGEHG
jgi:hypothetical protein